jgi:uncharacterized protein involved in exopolysaccharide biosynthesis
MPSDFVSLLSNGWVVCLGCIVGFMLLAMLAYAVSER